MQPQDPNAPQNNPGTSPAPDPNAGQKPNPAPEAPEQLTPTPSAAPAPAPAPEPAGPSGAPTMPPAKPSVMNKKLIAIILAAVLVIAAAVSAYFLFFNGIKLSTYNGDKFSLQYPEGYEQKDEDQGVMFNEKGDKNTASSVFAYYAEFPQKLEQEQLDAVTEEFKKQVESNFGSVANTDTEIKDVKIEDVQFKDQKAMQITGKGVKDGKDAGKVKLIAVLDTEKIYMIGVGAHTSDPGVAAAVDSIINSFALK